MELLGDGQRVEHVICIPVMVKDSLAQIAPAATAIGPPSQTARRLVAASVSTNTRRAYAGASGASMAVAAACFRAKLAEQPTPAGERTARVLSPATAGPPAIAAGARRARSARPTSRPCSPPAPFRVAAAAASSPTRWPPRVAAPTP